jgi:polysaccharide biosynthesis transport protein
MAMKNSLSYYILLVKRWTWLVILGIGICSGATFLISKFLPPLYQASSMIVVSINSSTSAYDNLNASVQAIPTYVDLLTNPEVLNPVVAQHQGLTLEELKSMMSVKPQANTQLIELDVENRDPVLAAQLANEIGRSFAQFANEQFPGTVQILPAQKPTDPVRPKPLLYTGIAAIVGLGLALALILMFGRGRRIAGHGSARDDSLPQPQAAEAGQESKAGGSCSGGGLSHAGLQSDPRAGNKAL